MRVLIGALLAIMFAIIGDYVVKTSKTEHRLAPTVSKILWACFVVVFFYLLSFVSTSEKLSLFAYSAYYISVAWLFYFFLQFAIEYIGHDVEQHVKKNQVMTFLLIDALFLLSNGLFGHFFIVKNMPLFGDDFYQLVLRPGFYVHYAIILVFAVCSIITLLFRFVTAPAFYRMKYLTIAVIMFVVLGLNIHSFRSPFDFSVIGYVAEAIFIYYCAFVYTPQRLLPKTLFMVAENMTVGLIAMDLEGKLVYGNKCAEDFLHGREELVDKQGVTLEHWCKDLSLSNTQELETEQTFYRGEEPLFFKIQMQRLLDKKKQLQGCYFVIQDRTEEINNLKQKQYLATHDRLTGLYNKEFFYEQVEYYIKRHPDEELLMVCTDIKDFKMINDFFGSKMGDAVLKNFAKMIQSKVEEAILFGRLDNDNFGILMAKSDFHENLFAIDTKEAFAGVVEDELSFTMVTYIGVYEIVERNLLVSVMFGRAKMAIATIKGVQHRHVAYYDNTLRENIIHEQELMRDLKQAIEEEQLQMYLHPQMDGEGRMLGAEALVRWIHPQKGMIPPDDFVPVFERNGLITDVDKHIWELACRQLRKWKEEGKRDLYISVNISPKDFYFLNIYQIFMDLIQKYEIDPKSLKLEITETAVMMDFARQLQLIDKLREAGFAVEMDDFGSGYSSLNMLKDIQVDVLKIDMAFLKKNQDTDRGKKILQMVIGLSKQLGIPVISEGVETVDQLAFLSEMGCDIFQGYYFAKPMSVTQFEENYLQ